MSRKTAQQEIKGRSPRSLPPSPNYRFSGQYLKISFALSWLVILAIVFGGLYGSEKADRLADIIVPSMVALIVALLGIHRAFGSMDFRSSQKHGSYAETEAEQEQEGGSGFSRDRETEYETGGYESAADGRKRND